MPTVLTGLNRLTGEQIRPIVSPLLELGSALHVLAEPGHHDRLEWAARIRATMTPAENAELDAWSWTYRAVRSRIFVTYPPAPGAGAATATAVGTGATDAAGASRVGAAASPGVGTGAVDAAGASGVGAAAAAGVGTGAVGTTGASGVGAGAAAGTGAVTAGSGWQWELERLRARPAEELAADLVRPLRGDGSGGLDDVRHWARSRGRVVDVLVEGLLADPDQAVGRFLGVLDHCWQTWFAAEWAQVAPRLTARARHDRDLAIRQDPAAMLISLDPAIDGKPGADSVIAQRLHSKRLDVGSRGLLLVPSAFVAPHLYLTEIPDEPVMAIYPVDGTAGPAVPTAKAIQTRLETLSSPIALRICRAVASEPRTAGEIAALWSINPTQVTRHLRALTRAGVVTAERQGRFVTYRLDQSAMRDLGTEILTLILR
ncbi:DUF5937 family protein [Kribbella sp. NBC_01245]|uniref:ArsR/SmtB family transcription factor n=1 Tax=Kribbella sp. NBC_01245 TaxID=2903578 RepID=UPI002E2C17AB|nr:DUF5937 family protein [Kribbella sp. NBC_01245]